MFSSKASTQSTAASTSSNSTSNAQRYPKNIFLVVSPSTSEARLRLVAETYGPVRSVHIPTAHTSRGFAFITFQWHEHARVCIEAMEGSALNGLVLHPQWASYTRKTASTGETDKNKRNGSQKRRDKRSQASKSVR